MELLDPSCLNSKNLWQTVFPRSPNSKMLPLRACPRQSWVAETPRPKTKAAELNDCRSMQSMQFIPRLDLSTQIQVPVLHHSLGRGSSQQTKLILMPMHVALVTTLSSLNSPMGVSMCMHVTNPQNHCQMSLLCLEPQPGMTPPPTKRVFW